MLNNYRLSGELWQTKSTLQQSSKEREIIFRYVKLINDEGSEFSEADTCQGWPQNIVTYNLYSPGAIMSGDMTGDCCLQLSPVIDVT